MPNTPSSERGVPQPPPIPPSARGKNKIVSDFEIIRSPDSNWTLKVAKLTQPSWKHKDRNGDSIVGDESRLTAEAEGKNINIHTDPKYVEADRKLVQKAAVVERQHAPQLKKLGVRIILDGIGGTGSGEDLIASRAAGAKLAETMAELEPDSDIGATMKKIYEAHRVANAEIAWIKGNELPVSEQLPEQIGVPNVNQDRQYELRHLGCTVELTRTVTTPDGKTHVVYGHAGDGAILHYDATTKQLRRVTRSQCAIDIALKNGVVNPDEYRAVMSFDPQQWPKRLQRSEQYANMIQQGVLSGIEGISYEERLKTAREVMKMLDEGNLVHGGELVYDNDLIDVGSFEVKSRDVVLQCSDGLLDNVEWSTLERELASGKSLTGIKKALVDQAVLRGGGAGVKHASGAKGPDDISLELIGFETKADDFKKAIEEAVEEEAIELSPEDIEEINAETVKGITATREALDEISPEEEAEIARLRKSMPSIPIANATTGETEKKKGLGQRIRGWWKR